MSSVAYRVTIGYVPVTWSSVKKETGPPDTARISSPVFLDT